MSGSPAGRRSVYATLSIYRPPIYALCPSISIRSSKVRISMVRSSKQQQWNSSVPSHFDNVWIPSWKKVCPSAYLCPSVHLFPSVYSQPIYAHMSIYFYLSSPSLSMTLCPSIPIRLPKIRISMFRPSQLASGDLQKIEATEKK